MTANDVRVLYGYGYWANHKLFEALAHLTTEEFTRDVAGSYGSIRHTLVHAMSAEWGWLERCGGAKRGDKLNAAAFPSLESVVQQWAHVETNTRQFLANATDVDMDRVVEFALGTSNYVMKVGELLHHGAVHSTHHRGQVALLTRMLGKSAGNFDALFYYAGKRLEV